MGFCAAERVNTFFLCSVSTDLKNKKINVQHENKLHVVTWGAKKKSLFSHIKGAFSCDLRRVQMGFRGRIAGRLRAADRYGNPGRNKAGAKMHAETKNPNQSHTRAK